MLTINLNPFPVLTTERLLFRQITLQDAPEIFFLRSDDEVMRYIDKIPEKNIDETKEHILRSENLINNNEAIIWGLALINKPEKLIGNICLWKFQKEHYRGELGYVLHPDHWRKGLAKEAITKVVDFGFKKLHLHSIEAHINPENIGSQKALESTGFKREAYFKENYFFKGSFLDTAVYSIISPD